MTISLLGFYAPSGTPTPTPTPTPGVPDYVSMMTHGDSRVVGVQYPEDATTTYTDAMQWNAGVFSATVVPIQQAIGGDANVYISPVTSEYRRIIDDTTCKVDFMGGGYNGQSVVLAGAPLGAGGSTTTANKARAAAMYAARGTASPGAVIAPLIVTTMLTNDMLGNLTADSGVVSSIKATFADLRSATGFSAAPIVVNGTLPETANVPGDVPTTNARKLLETAHRIAALQTSNCYYVAMPSGHTTDNVHESDATQTRDIGYNYTGRVALVALGQRTGITPDFSAIPATLQPVEGTSTPISLPCSQPVYYTSVTVGGSTVQLSGDLEFIDQVLKPAAGTWPTGFSGTISINYITGDRITGTLTRTLSVQSVSTVFVVKSGYTGTSAASVPVVLGKRYLVCGWDGSGINLDGSIVSPISITTPGIPLRIYEYVPGTSHTATFTPSGGTQLLWVVEVTGKAFNSSHAELAAVDRNGAFNAGSAMTNYGLAVLLDTGGSPSVNMTLLDSSAPFYLYISTSTVTPAGNFPNGFTALAGVGLT